MHVCAHSAQINLPQGPDTPNQPRQYKLQINHLWGEQKPQHISGQRADLNGESGRSGQNMLKKNPNHTQIFTAQYEQEVLHKHITFQRIFSMVGRKISLEKCARSKQKFSFSILWLFFCNVILQSK